MRPRAAEMEAVGVDKNSISPGKGVIFVLYWVYPPSGVVAPLRINSG